MYNIPPPGVHNGLGLPPGQFPLGATANTQQQPNSTQQIDSRQPGNPPSQLAQGQQQQQQQQQPVPYGMQQTPSIASNKAGGAPSNDATSAPGAPGNNAGIPPGMPSMYQQPNPAYLAYGQFNQMGHPAYGMQAYGYG
eukprot:95991_1